MILLYHDIPDHQRTAFARQMDIVCRTATPVADPTAATAGMHRREVMVTFDDGFASFATNALPEMEKRGIVPTLFVVSGKLGCRADWACNFRDELPKENLLTAEQLRELSSKVIFASQTITHPMLTEIPADDVRREVEGSRRELESLLGCPINWICVPYGAFNAHVIECCMAAGYEHLFSTLPDLVVKSDFVIGRVDAEPWDWDLEFRLKVAGCYRWLPWAFRLKRMITGLVDGSGTSAAQKANSIISAEAVKR
ncbi:polysaccharide deacetylase family protein [Occallatibacter riparius]|uniref:Polysaccharide deacetylase family protein n=1 Tax=Occallatibacter riparius TaxID=1002689 RepID=A0A9J7BLF7_9BACT|nr:polysaccharide deacetylase family protein [Occallatibacter riparius]UWZ83716.1 polysaccharide deacetylase family protein [Occallatibacter riparius]